MSFKDLIEEKDNMPENLEEVFLSNLQVLMKEAYNKIEGTEFLSFIESFIKECGHEIYEFHLKTFTKEELWKSILISKTEEYKKMILFAVDYNKFLGILMCDFEDKEDKKEWQGKMKKLGEELEDEWTTE